eukprot:EG_transcript_7881
MHMPSRWVQPLPLSFPLLPLLLLVLLLSPACLQQFLHLSDLHFDPFYGTANGYKCITNTSPPFGKFGCDSPERLIRSTIAAAKTALPNPAFIVITGDFVRHGANQMPNSNATTVAVVANLTWWLVDAFGNSTPVLAHHFLPALGNNDVEPDYEVEVPPGGNLSNWLASPSPLTSGSGDYFLQHLADVWQGVLPDTARDTFRLGGFYSFEVVSGLFILSLNTLVYSPYHVPDSMQLDDPYGQFQWMGDTLKSVRQQGGMVYIIGHIPPMKDSFGLTLLWVDKYITKYLTIVQNYSDVVKGQLYGHVHSDEFRTFPAQSGLQYPMFIVGAVTPIYTSNPSFRIWNYDTNTKELLDYTAWYADLNATNATQALQWGPMYDARQLFGLRNLSNRELRGLASRLSTNDTLWQAYVRVSHAGAPFACDAVCRRKMVCLFLNLRDPDFGLCFNASGSSVSSSPSPSGSSAVPSARPWPLLWMVAGASVAVCMATAGLDA